MSAHLCRIVEGRTWPDRLFCISAMISGVIIGWHLIP